MIIASFSVLGFFGYKAISNAPPIPKQVVSADGRVLFDENAIQNGQGVWQSIGGQEVGSIWGHGAYIAPDWTADWLHRELVFVLDEEQACKPGFKMKCGRIHIMLQQGQLL